MTTTVGRVAGLWRFPVKSFQGEPLTTLTLTPAGVVGDRQWAAIDLDTGRALSAKTVPALLEVVAATTGEGDGVGFGVEVTLPDGTVARAGDPEADAALSAWLGRPVALRHAGDTRGDGDQPVTYEMTFDPPDDEAELVDIPVPDGSYVDLFAVHLLTTTSLATVTAARPDGNWDIRRFRPNVLVETAALADGFPEDAWVGRRVGLGAGGAGLDVVMRTMRCALPLRPQPAFADATRSAPALPRDVDIYRTLSAVHDNDLGAYAAVAEPGDVRLGDEVVVSAAAGA
jgi:uncharacterized protein